jgi:hypothetical protein
MADKVNCEFFVAMNEYGGWIVTTEESDALSDLGSAEGGYLGRVIKITAMIAPPVMTEAMVDVPDEAGETTKIEATAA